MLLLSITTWWAALGSTEQIYWGIALISSSIFIIQLILTFIGLDADLEAEIDSGDGLGIISVRSLIAFATFFGWGGVAALSAGLSTGKTFMIAFLCGFIAMIALAYMLAQIWKMQETGTVDVYNAISQEGEVYIPIPEAMKGKGKIHVNVQEKLMEFDAVSEEKLATGMKIKVVDVLNENVMLVTAIT